MDRNEYLEIVSAQVRCKRAVPYLAKELTDHIEDQKEAYIADGMNPFEAEMAAVREMGDPVETGVQLDRVHRPKMEWKILAGAIVMGIVGLAIQLFVAKGYCPSESFGWYVGLMSRQLLGIAAGTVIMMIIYFLDYSLLIRWAFPCWVMLHILMIGCCVFGTRVNGRSLTAIQLTYILVPFYAGVVYRFRGAGSKGLVKSMICLAVSVLTVFEIPDISSAFIIGATGVIILSIAIYQKWFGRNVKSLFAGMFGSMAGTFVCIVGWFFLRNTGLKTYRTERLKAWFNQDGWNSLLTVISDTVESVKDGNIMPGTIFEYVRNDYIWKYLFEYLGTWRGIRILSVFVIFMAAILKAVLKQKNRLGYIVGIGCVAYLCLQAFLYVAMNFGLLPLSGKYMPFFSHGMAPIIVTYFYMGILLSIFRNSNIVRN